MRQATRGKDRKQIESRCLVKRTDANNSCTNVASLDREKGAKKEDEEGENTNKENTNKVKWMLENEAEKQS